MVVRHAANSLVHLIISFKTDKAGVMAAVIKEREAHPVFHLCEEAADMLRWPQMYKQFCVGRSINSFLCW
jgi:hypothetical protein